MWKEGLLRTISVDEKWRKQVERLKICDYDELQSNNLLDCEKIGRRINGYFRKQRQNWGQRPQSVQTVNLGKGNTIKPLGIDASDDYIAVIVDRFHLFSFSPVLTANSSAD
ncbi:Oidioi.mRNA.OKI2018_I69.PAR.g12885.t1.cds [Oikopleura dioica]|uniref:Oidioi.mRNA.OKI2018_I69.PAR.g12885.t1.cds n=1 Tax=Oikopleura dioica TaxID=34765 RepID=A0ABN7S6V2_OIKDI|nr:Oidioi.mRNA.OKI2018_I69.PAR.g12885.t1.cds [Oikopleura dioica]